MTDDDLQQMARECGAAPLFGDRWERMAFTSNALQTFALRIEAQAIKSEQQGRPHTDSAMNCELVFSNGKLIAVKT